MQQATLHHRPINFKKERSFSQKLNATFEFLSQNFRPITKNILLIAGPFALLTGIFYGMYQGETFGAVLAGRNDPFGAEGPNTALLVTGVIGMMVCSIIALTLIVAVTMRHLRQYIAEGHARISTGAVWAGIGREFFQVLGTSIALLIGVLFATGIIALPVILLSAAEPTPVLIGLMMLLMFIAILIIYPALTLLYPIRSMEGVGIFTAFSRLFKLISGKWLSTAGLVIIVGFIQSIMGIIFAVPMYIMMFMQVMHVADGEATAEAPGMLYNILFSLASGVSMLGSFALYSILFIAITFQYYSLRERKEASGLLERMESFGVQKNDLHDEDEHY
ncbi:V-type ATP synthase subunit I domain-containing protein [Nafulsella turpanensis]|uniref:hypothetical protein n=1 Tax=Nafulsella turpanensis TaxID=1265690 RepID=UPI00034C1710|nr:hypothetical protein [Nafulsella turpanensis]